VTGRVAAVSILLAVATLAAGCAADDSQGPETPVLPYCQVDRLVPDHLTVVGPAGGWVTVNGRDHKALTLVTGDDIGREVAPDAGPYDGLLYNVPGPGEVAVDGHVCMTS